MSENERAARNRKITKIIMWIVLLILFIMIVFPFIMVVINVFKTKADINSHPLALIGKHGFTTKNFPKAMKKMHFWRVFGNSLIITLSSTVLTLLLSAMCAFVLVRNKWKACTLLFTMMIASMVIPFQVLMVPLVSFYGGLLNVLNHRLTLILMHTGFSLSMATFLYHGAIHTNIPLELEEAALIEPASIGYYGLERAGFDPHTNLLIIGTGPISLGGMACAKAMGIGKTIVAGRKDAKLEVAKKLGADITVNMTRENLLDVVMRETDGRGMDIVMDSTGAPELLNDAMFMLRGSGSLVIPAFYEQVLNGVKLDRLIVKNCTLIGAAGTPNMADKMLAMMETGRLNLLPMMTDRFPFAEVKEAFNAVTARNESRVKVMVDF